jgi:hypothetical protein
LGGIDKTLSAAHPDKYEYIILRSIFVELYSTILAAVLDLLDVVVW